MAETIVNFTSSSGGTSWTNPAKATDGIDDSYAECVTGDSSATPLTASSLASLGTIGTITKVEIGWGGYRSGGGGTRYLQPVFDGYDGGSAYPFESVPTADDDAMMWADVTADGDGPGTGNWTSADVAALNVRLWHVYTSKVTTYCDWVQVRVTHETAATFNPASYANRRRLRGSL